ncbi:MAG: tRNA (N6-threonylcarbamoyladenosine(37)-N6)-methyltransferase TrmO [Chloroflexi bacterium]|nr:tRNA (N6-threonylcarbamoyladenosine(37)-N6)-methyltransferase TrmO [Chloroflexota bacterium]
MAHVTVTPIGFVHNSVTGPKHEGWEDVVSELVFDQKLAPALEGIEGFSHVLVLTWLDQVPPDKRSLLKLHPMDRQDVPLVGVFATRTQYRPNPIGASVVRLLERRGHILVVQGLDALDGTPVLDIKPHSSYHLPSEPVTVPEWNLRLHDQGR